MKAGPLSNPEIISLLNRSFVPVYAVNEDYRQDGAASPEERAEYQRIFREAAKAGLSTGTVHVYLLTPDGHPSASLHVATAAKVERLLDLLEQTTKQFKTAEGKPLVPPRAQSAPPQAAADALVLHLVARYLGRKGDDLAPLRAEAHLGQTRHASWSALPSENWVILDREEWPRLLPAGEVRTGTAWDFDKRVGAKLLQYFYPQTENNDYAKNRIDQQSLRATVVSADGGVVRARIDGSLKMKHPFYHRDDGNMVEATLVGWIEFEPAGKQIRSLHLVTDQATYGRTMFGAALRSFGD